MDENLIRCVRCKGRKKLFKVHGAYSMTNTGGTEVTCPMCNGLGKMKTLEHAKQDIEGMQDAIRQSESKSQARRKAHQKETSRRKTDEVHT